MNNEAGVEATTEYGPGQLESSMGHCEGVRAEVKRFGDHVTDWEQSEYLELF